MPPPQFRTRKSKIDHPDPLHVCLRDQLTTNTMRRSIIVTFLAPTTLAQDTSRIRTRSSTNAVCTNTPVSGPLPTSTFLAVLSAHLNEDEECPRSALLNVHYHNEDDVGCCTQSAILTVASGTPACCSCGATCTGSVPSMVDWTFTAGQFVTTAVSQLPTTSGTLSPTPTAAGMSSSLTSHPFPCNKCFV
ncbi:hypothetical protein B0H67DRAFT_566255 [Lasiosphaeris hirsuta]|uniref:Uncharacterized protein n=1 Tax=Lasiosphaeris hirsuta TaxID=260670 RepID=A0AA40BCX5_9PEZI|nr:hypothetical protein B0H67DRAFT_566255 [Lasiosphaeris hirsuta]